MTRTKATISDVAKHAKVSVGTVSHVLTGIVPVSSKRQERVLKAIEALHYVPNFHARGLRRAQTNVVGICIPHVSTAYLNTVSEALEDVAAADGYSIMHVFSRHDPAAELRRVRDLLNYHVDGMVLLPSTSPEKTLDLAYQNGLPMVLIDRPTGDRRFDQVILDNRKTTRDAARRLIELGHRRLMFICRSRGRLSTRHRIEGLNAARRQARVAVSIAIVEYNDDEAALAHTLEGALRAADAPTAVIVSNSHQASLMLGTLRRLDIACPQRVSVLGFDDPDWSEIVTPRLSVIRQPALAIADQAWTLLMRRIRHPHAAIRQVALEAQIDFRESIARVGGAANDAKTVGENSRPRTRGVPHRARFD